ncbi:MAG: hypothetical protein ACRYFX_12105 [Janthinobacterium lividum]
MAEATSNFQPLRAELEPQLAVAEQRFPHILRLITDYDEASDDGDEAKIQAVVESLRQLTGKDISEADLFEYYEAGSKEELALRLALPAPMVVAAITKAEVLEILRRLQEPQDFTKPWEELSFAEQVGLYYLVEYYQELLKINFPTTCRHRDFGRRWGPDGRYYKLTREELAARLLA